MNEKMVDRLMEVMARAGGTPLEPLRDALVRAAGQSFDMVYGIESWRQKAEVIHPLSGLIASQVGDPFKRWDTSDIPAFRAEFEQMLDYLPKRVVCAREDRTLEFGNVAVKVRSFRPRVVKRNVKVIYLHGGGFVLGGFDSNDPECDRIARGLACEVLSVGYPLSPEHKAPTALETIIYALTDGGLIGNAPFVLVGESAGGNLAVAALQNSAMLPKSCIGLVLVYPYLDLTLSGESAHEYRDGYFLTKGLLEWFAQCYIGSSPEAKDATVSPLFGDMSTLPPSLVLVGEFDPLRSDAVRFADRHPGTRVEVFSGMIHGFLQLRGLSPSRNKALKTIIRFIEGL